MKIIIDRIEGAIALVDFGGEIVEIPAAALPEGAVEGNALSLVLCEDDGLQEARDRLARLQSRTPPENDIEL